MPLGVPVLVGGAAGVPAAETDFVDVRNADALRDTVAAAVSVVLIVRLWVAFADRLGSGNAETDAELADETLSVAFADADALSVCEANARAVAFVDGLAGGERLPLGEPVAVALPDGDALPRGDAEPGGEPDTLALPVTLPPLLALTDTDAEVLVHPLPLALTDADVDENATTARDAASTPSGYCSPRACCRLRASCRQK